jgi:uncharacterized membrane protein YkgB
MIMSLSQVDLKIIKFLKRFYESGARAAIFIIFFWFGALKVFGKSPANPLVESLLHKTLPFVSFSNFIIFFGAFEMLLGVLFIIKGAERILMPLFALHIFTTALPLFFLPQITWQGFLTPTLEGQYIIKNLALLALAIMIASHLKPIKESE